MVEIECPNCQARYQVPAEALGPTGRDVTCSSCGTVWHATARPAPVEATAIGVQVHPPQRRAQMAEIRQMLDEVQSGDSRRAAPQSGHAAERWGARAEAIEPPKSRADVHEAVFGHARGPAGRADDQEDDDGDFLRSRMGVAGQSGRLKTARARETQEDAAGSRKRLLHKHRRRNRKFEDAKRRGTGAGLTGFMLVLMVGGVLAGLYALDDRIVAAAPETEQVMRNYVAAVDGMRAGLQDRFSGIRGLIDSALATDEG